ncbi:hypothetical protein N1851_000353 [Merluccius polli]|uniref:Uncharacterized protein n=1 Tax=Merluccius polli TaxID=89951 RepID=A0AA47NDQ5_MERPO|nr:hypothetical protein N1851_000353 [Merluccius polli]
MNKQFIITHYNNNFSFTAASENAEKPNGALTIHNTEANKAVHVIVETDGPNVEALVNGSEEVPLIPTEAQVISKKDVPTITKQQANEGEKVNHFDVMFKKKLEEPADIATKQASESFEEPKSASLDLEPAEGQTHNTDDQKSQPVERQEESDPDKNPVMNFFKTLVTPTKSQKKETAIPDVTKDQVAQVPEPPAAPKGMSIPPPPPPEPPKMEIKGEPAVRPQKPTPKEGAKASAKQPEASKGKSAKDTLGRFFRSKAIQEVLVPVVQVQDTVQDEPEPVLEVKETVECLPQPVVEAQTVEEEVPHPVVVEVESLCRWRMGITVADLADVCQL